MKSKALPIAAAVLAAAFIGLLALGCLRHVSYSAHAWSDDYVKTYFSEGSILEVNITIEESELADMYENPLDKEKKSAAVTINDTTLSHVAVATKGDMTLKQIASSDSNRYSLKLTFDEYVDGQTLSGLRALNLNSQYSDSSQMREYLSYQIFAQMGVPSCAVAYAKVSINGEYQGLYLAVEEVDEPYLERWFGEVSGDLYKPDGTAGSDLRYVGDDIADYAGIVCKSERENPDEDLLLGMIAAINEGEEIERYLNVDEMLRYFAVSTALVNLDSYQGSQLHNYYLYEQDGVFSILPWDLNMSFGGFAEGSSTALSINNPTTTLLSERPLLNALLSEETYRQTYYEYLAQVAQLLSEEHMSAWMAEIDALIGGYVAEDPTAFYSYEQYLSNFETKSADSGASIPSAQPETEARSTDTATSPAQDTTRAADFDPVGKKDSLPDDTEENDDWAVSRQNGMPAGGMGGMAGSGESLLAFCIERSANLKEQLAENEADPSLFAAEAAKGQSAGSGFALSAGAGADAPGADNGQGAADNGEAFSPPTAGQPPQKGETGENQLPDMPDTQTGMPGEEEKSPDLAALPEQTGNGAELPQAPAGAAKTGGGGGAPGDFFPQQGELAVSGGPVAVAAVAFLIAGAIFLIAITGVVFLTSKRKYMRSPRPSRGKLPGRTDTTPE